MADIVLPATTAYERNDLEMGGDYAARYLFPMHQVVPPQFESRNDFIIFADISERLGYREKFTEGKDETQWLQAIYASAATGSQRAGVPIPSFDAFWRSGDYIEFPVPDESKEFVRLSDFRLDPLLNGLGTPSGLIEIYSQAIAKMNYPDCKPHPCWFEPDEWWKPIPARARAGASDGPAAFATLEHVAAGPVRGRQARARVDQSKGRDVSQHPQR